MTQRHRFAGSTDHPIHGLPRIRRSVPVLLAIVLAACGGAAIEEIGLVDIDTSPILGSVAETAAPAITSDGAGSLDSAVADVLTVAVYGQPVLGRSGLNTPIEMEIGRLLDVGLTTLDQTNRPQAGIARAWETTDGTTWTFELSPDAVFQDGSPVDAAAVARGLAAAAATRDGGAHMALQAARVEGFAAVASGDVESLGGVQTIDERTVRIVLERPNRLLPTILAHPGLAPLAEDPRSGGTGMYELADRSDLTLTLIPSPEFALGPRPDHGIRFRLLSDDETVDPGDYDIAPITGATEDVDEAQVVTNPTWGFNYLAFPVDDERWSDARLRTALSLATDRDALLEALALPDRRPATGFVPSGLPGSSPDGCTKCRFDADEARRLAEEAGGFENGRIELAYNTGRGHEQMMQLLAEQWTEVFDVEVEFVPLSRAPYFEAIEDGEMAGPFRLGWSADYAHAMAVLEPLFGPEALSGYHTDALAAALDSFAALEDPLGDDGTDAVRKISGLLDEDMPIVPLFEGVSVRRLGSSLDDVPVANRGGLRLEGAILGG